MSVSRTLPIVVLTRMWTCTVDQQEMVVVVVVVQVKRESTSRLNWSGDSTTAYI